MLTLLIFEASFYKIHAMQESIPYRAMSDTYEILLAIEKEQLHEKGYIIYPTISYTKNRVLNICFQEAFHYLSNEEQATKTDELATPVGRIYKKRMDILRDFGVIVNDEICGQVLDRVTEEMKC